jgi:hypothetical protein
MKIIESYTTEELGKTMPTGPLKMVTALEHDQRFYAFDTTDVWTDDGWLITAVKSDGLTHFMRKGRWVRVAMLPPDTMLHYKPDPKTSFMLGEQE